MRVILLPNVLEYLSFEETALTYVLALYDDIIINLPLRRRKPAPPYFDRYGKGMYYVTFKKSRYTHWYVFFRVYCHSSETIYQVRYITNNYVAAQHLL